MNTLKSFMIGCGVAACLAPAVAFADSVFINDDSNGANTYYGGDLAFRDSYGGTTVYGATSDDVIGADSDYDVSSMEVTRTSDSLTVKLTGNYFLNDNDKSEFIGDLFLSSTGWTPVPDGTTGNYTTDNFNAVGTTAWDYVLHITATRPGSGLVPGGNYVAGQVALYAIDPATGGTVLLSDTTVQEVGYYRSGQAVQYDPTDGAAALYTTGPGGNAGGGFVLNSGDGTFTFSLEGVDLAALGLDGDLGLHWTMSCGNDVIEGALLGAPRVPEPATMLLFGVGLSGLAAYRRRMKK
jgi:hypothetical protein